ncbi:KGG domain-containing protein [Cognatilysobacter bugurensis]|nr:KGG domain-containing protein [Lysobacter bugurensis]
MTQASGNERQRSGRGFASMDPEKQRAISSKGGRAAHRSGNAHEFDSQQAREAGRLGGRARAANARRRMQAENQPTAH